MAEVAFRGRAEGPSSAPAARRARAVPDLLLAPVGGAAVTLLSSAAASTPAGAGGAASGSGFVGRDSAGPEAAVRGNRSAPPCRGNASSGTGGWNSTVGAGLGRGFRGGADMGSSAGGNAFAGVGGGVKVAFGERLRACSRGGSLGGCSCMSMERSLECDPAHDGNA
ncbi:hypothetical protein [Micromonospora sp. CPCC 205711]|uniref:hypothetical protein n=1 Tax=Micromonospora sp. CPCC 205547 TaxID=3122400 RepID=UPI002FEEAC39